MRIQFEKEHIEIPSEDGKRIQFLIAPVQQEKGYSARIIFRNLLDDETVPLSHHFRCLKEAQEAMTTGFDVLEESAQVAKFLMERGVANLICSEI